MEVLLFTTPTAPAGLLAEVRSLLDEAFGGEFSDDDWAHTLGGWHAVAMDGGVPVSHAACVARVLEAAARPFRTGYVEGVATAPARRRQGLATAVMASIGDVVRREFELGALSTGAHPLYERQGWERWRGPTFVRSADGTLARTADDDDGVMVLRFGPSLGLDLAAPLTCQAREGDDW